MDLEIKHMHQHFGLNYEGRPRILPAEEENFRIACMLEEISEFVLAKDIEQKYDALLDLIIFAAGTAERMGLPIEPGLREVIRANMEKVVGPNAKRGGFATDLQKPEGWEPPQLRGIVDAANHC